MLKKVKHMKKLNNVIAILVALVITNLITVCGLTYAFLQIRDLNSIDQDIVQMVHELRVELVKEGAL
jgi:hypothetical protein